LALKRNKKRGAAKRIHRTSFSVFAALFKTEDYAPPIGAESLFTPGFLEFLFQSSLVSRWLPLVTGCFLLGVFSSFDMKLPPEKINFVYSIFTMPVLIQSRQILEEYKAVQPEATPLLLTLPG
jgi:hypothetical protein